MVRVAFILLLLPQLVRAEYRAYLLTVTDRTSQQQNLVLTTFDPHQYLDLHLELKNKKIEIKETWMCWGDTANHIPICPQPAKLAAQPSAL